MNEISPVVKLWTIIERDFTASLMNTTKWTEALEAVKDQKVHYKIKLITEADPSFWRSRLQYGGDSSYLPRGWIEGPYSPFPVLEIEWMEIQPVTAEIETRFRALNIPFEVTSDTIRIVGHIRR